MPKLSVLFRIPTPELLLEPKAGFIRVNEKQKFRIMLYFAILTLVAAFFFNSPVEIYQGLWRIIMSPSILLTDYMVVGNIGSAFFNSGLLMLITILITRRNKVVFSGPIVAAIFTIGGFAFFGKNIFNVSPIMVGVLVFAKLRREPFRTLILPAFFGTALGPLVSQIAFGFDLPLRFSLPLGILCGLLAGILLPNLANHFIQFHQGYNLYNIGFTAGIIGMLFISVFRAMGFQIAPASLVLEDQSIGLYLYLCLLLLSMTVIGFWFTRSSWQNMAHLWKMPGQLVSDFISSNGFGLVLLNMAILGFVSIAYLFIVGSSISGPVIGGIFTVIGFAAFGKHLRNTLPIMLGVYLANQIFVWDVSSTGSVLAALFATTLAPIAGAYGLIPGIIAGFLHMTVVMNVGYLHGGVNLYNNGFSGGFVAAIMIPILNALISVFSRNREDFNQ